VAADFASVEQWQKNGSVRIVGERSRSSFFFVFLEIDAKHPEKEGWTCSQNMGFYTYVFEIVLCVGKIADSIL
jgi:hypothetical protein